MFFFGGALDKARNKLNLHKIELYNIQNVHVKIKPAVCAGIFISASVQVSFISTAILIRNINKHGSL